MVTEEGLQIVDGALHTLLFQQLGQGDMYIEEIRIVLRQAVDERLEPGLPLRVGQVGIFLHVRHQLVDGGHQGGVLLPQVLFRQLLQEKHCLMITFAAAQRRSFHHQAVYVGTRHTRHHLRRAGMRTQVENGIGTCRFSLPSPAAKPFFQKRKHPLSGIFNSLKIVNS